jgi:tetratricopeptide (TPR) repeat protein
VINASGASHKALAHRVNEYLHEWGKPARYTHTSVANWMRGMTPRWPTPRFVAAALGERLGRPVSLAEIGMAGAETMGADVGLNFPRPLPAAIDTATQFWSHVNRRDFFSSSFAAAAYAVPVRRWLIQPADRRAQHKGSVRVGRTDITELNDAAERARHWDSKYGGGSSGASQVSACLQDRAAPLLSGTYTDEIGAELFAATARLARLAGFAAFDMGYHDLAQRHYVQALRLARAAGDIPFGGYVLVTMAMQAALRGFHEDAIDMAQAAFERAKHVATPRTLAFFQLIEARAHARAGDRRAAGHTLAASERLLGLVNLADDDPPWIDFYDYSRLAADATEINRDLNMPHHVLRWNIQATMPTSRFVRSYGMRLAIVGSGHLQAGQLDEGLVLGHQSIDVLQRVASTRSLDYLRDFTARLEPWSRERAVQEFRQRALRETGTRA